MEVDPTRSGESLFQSKLARTGDPVLSHLPSTFLELLAEGTSADEVPWKLEETKKELRAIADCARACRVSRCASFHEVSRAMARCCQEQVARTQLRFARYDQHTQASLRMLDQQLLTLVLHYYATIEKELDIHAQRVRAEDSLCRGMEAQARASYELSKFAVHLAAETGKQVNFRRLPASHPQFLRCRRAALENVKSGFFVPHGRYTGISVLDVFKIENRPMLRRFQKASSGLEAGKVKGLFCTLPARSIHRLVAFGLGVQTVSAAERAAVFRGTWMAAINSIGIDVPVEGVAVDWSKHNLAEQAVMRAEAVPLPRVFSRYSTLSEDKRLVQTPAGASSAAASGREEEEGESGIRYLALCRVIVNRVYVTSKDKDGFPAMPENSSYSAMYNPKQEEYLLTSARDVLPEFLVQYKYINKARQADAAARLDISGRAPTRTGPTIVATDLTVAEAPVTDEVGVGRAVQIVEAHRGNSSLSALMRSISSSPLVPTDHGRPPSSRSRARLHKGGEGERDLPWTELRSNAAHQRTAALRAARGAVNSVWKQLRLRCKKDKPLATTYPKVGASTRGATSSAAATKATVVALKESIITAERELARVQGKRMELERGYASQAPRRRRR